MRSLLSRVILALVLGMLVTNGLGAENGTPRSTLVKITVRNGQVIWGELESQHRRRVTVVDLTTGKELELNNGDISAIAQSVTDDQVAKGCGVDALAAMPGETVSA